MRENNKEKKTTKLVKAKALIRKETKKLGQESRGPGKRESSGMEQPGTKWPLSKRKRKEKKSKKLKQEGKDQRKTRESEMNVYGNIRAKAEANKTKHYEIPENS